MRPVHYAATGTSGLVFRCWRQEVTAHLDSGYVREGRYAKGYKAPTPRRHTDLRRVTCLECWAEILAMAQEALAKAKP